MKIAVMSDSHDNIWKMRNAVDWIKKNNVEMIVHCGDFVAPFMLKELEMAGVPVHGVFGNNDGDQHLLTRMSLTGLKNITIHGLIGKIEAGGIAIAFTHYFDIAEGLAATGKHDLVCFGHSHTHMEERAENINGKSTILLNPGEIMGKDGSPGFCCIDTDTMKIERVDI